MTMLVSFLFVWTSQRPLIPLTSKYYSHLSVATVSNKGNALAWMRSYLSNTFQYVRVANVCPSKHKLACGVPERSVYSMYTALIADVIKRQGMGFHFYADDTQIYMSFNPADAL